MDIADETAARKAMVDNQIATSSVTDARVLALLRRVPRALFLPADRRALAYSDAHHPLGQGRFLPAPAVFARLVQLAEISQTHRVLDYWPATGYSTAILAGLAREVVGLEPDQVMAAAARANLTTLGVTNASIIESDQLPPGEHFDVILIEGAVARVPEGLLDRLASGGRLVCLLRQGPVGVATVHERTGNGIVVQTAFNATLPAIDTGPVPEAFVF